MSPASFYLGDGCYVAWDGRMLKLTTSDGVRDTNTIYLEPETLAALELFIAAARRVSAAKSEGGAP